MPHQCTDCGRTFEDGSKQMLSGCPDCGGNKFQYQPAGEDSPPSEEPPEPPEPPVDSSVARTVGSAATAVRDLVGSGQPPEDDAPPSADSPDTPDPEVPGDAPAPETVEEDAAQKSARSDVVSKDDLPPAPDSPATSKRTPVLNDDSERPRGADRERDRPDLSELREELNDQFESIKVLDPGKYELNLMELYDREEYIIALQEDGKYTIQVPERWEED
ncbi:MULTISPECIES: OapC/ArvC family zinc-ribbon domain-containing protein [Salinibaculum]|uniref:OapC/ArvC family zinc-ribbon domain-containing protein n=1 Tax=Salinibaculum TaxID=2732368 RepID=UPI0030D2D3D1